MELDRCLLGACGRNRREVAKLHEPKDFLLFPAGDVPKYGEDLGLRWQAKVRQPIPDLGLPDLHPLVNRQSAELQQVQVLRPGNEGHDKEVDIHEN